jgi:hypothetical protein
VQYRPDILALYGDLFRETHTTLEKRAGIGAKLRQIYRAVRGVVPRGQGVVDAARAEAAAAKARAAAAAQEAAAAQRGRAAAEAQVGQHQAARAEAEAAAAQAAKQQHNAMIAAGVGIPVASLGGYALGRPSAEELQRAQTKHRNIAFGAGMAAGLTTPFIIRGLGQLAGSMYGGPGLLPGDYPALLPGPGY